MTDLVDPVCGMTVGEEAPRTEYAGTTYYFCSEPCREAFEKEPERFAVEVDKSGM